MSEWKTLITVILIILVAIFGSVIPIQITVANQNDVMIQNAIEEFAAISSDLGRIDNINYSEMEKTVMSTGGFYEIRIIVSRFIMSVNGDSEYVPIFEMSNTREVSAGAVYNLRVGDELEIIVIPSEEGSLAEQTISKLGMYKIKNRYTTCVKVRNDGV